LPRLGIAVISLETTRKLSNSGNATKKNVGGKKRNNLPSVSRKSTEIAGNVIGKNRNFGAGRVSMLELLGHTRLLRWGAQEHTVLVTTETLGMAAMQRRTSQIG